MSETLYNLQVICNGLAELAHGLRKRRVKKREKVEYEYVSEYDWYVGSVSTLERSRRRLEREEWVKGMKG